MEGRKSELETERAKGVLDEDLDERKIIVGSVKNPIWIGPISEAKEFFTPDFELLFEIWRRFKAGMGMPKGSSWTLEHPDISDAVLIFQEHWEAFYRDKPIISRLDALLNRG